MLLLDVIMEKVMIISNKNIVIATVMIILISIGSYTTYKVYQEHQKKLLLVSEKRITEAAYKCFLEEQCLDSKITLNKLYEYNYLEEEANPLTKEVYSGLSYVENNDGKYVFYPLY